MSLLLAFLIGFALVGGFKKRKPEHCPNCCPGKPEPRKQMSQIEWNRKYNKSTGIVIMACGGLILAIFGAYVL